VQLGFIDFVVALQIQNECR